MDEPKTHCENSWRWAFGLTLLLIAVVLTTIVQQPVVLLVFLLGLVMVYSGFYCVHFILSLPFRRRERARMFLELLDASV